MRVTSDLWQESWTDVLLALTIFKSPLIGSNKSASDCIGEPIQKLKVFQERESLHADLRNSVARCNVLRLSYPNTL